MGNYLYTEQLQPNTDTRITNEKLIEFLESRIALIKKGDYAIDEFLEILAFYIEHFKSPEEASDDKLRQYAMLGWYIEHTIKEANSS